MDGVYGEANRFSIGVCSRWDCQHPTVKKQAEASRPRTWGARKLQLTRPVRTHRSDLPEIIRTLGDAVDMIDEHLPETLRIRPVWQQVKDMLVTAAETRMAQDVETATNLLEHALEEEGWLH
jgi:hypothetical protein